MNDLKMDVEADEVNEKIVFEINSAVIAGDGYQRNFFLEDKIGGYSGYMVEVKNYTSILYWDGLTKYSGVAVDSINGTIREGWNNIRNVDGVIYVD
jgi:hypothetical protein